MFKKLIVVVVLISLSLIFLSVGCGKEDSTDSSNQSTQNNPYDGTWKGYIWSSYYNSGIGNVVVSNGNFSVSGKVSNFCNSGSTGVSYKLSGTIGSGGGMSSVILTGALSPSGTSGVGSCVNNECWVEVDFYPCGTYAYTSLFLQLTR